MPPNAPGKASTDTRHEAVVDEAAIRDLLPRTWHAFYGRFGRLREVQLRATGPVLDGRDVLIGAPTASGKTEALMAPLTERVLGSGQGTTGDSGPIVLVISPTRALVNDLARRLTPPVRAVGLTLGRKHGDLARGPDSRLEHVLITTPESLDSMLARGPRRLCGVRAVVLDELHLLQGTARGDQLRALLQRLERVATERPQRCAATATHGRPDRLVREFLAASPHGDPVVVRCGGQRLIQARLVEGATTDDVAGAVIGEARAGAKLIVFANRRSQVEGLAARLSEHAELRGRVYVHHGSLGKAERERVERRFATQRGGICVATTTLEIGVDIGGVDGVVLVAPPPDVRSLLQRAGRGNRSGAVTRVLGLYDGALERHRFEHLLECAAAGRMFEEVPPLRPNVASQQALSLIMQSPKGWVSARALGTRLPQGELTEADCSSVLATLAEAEVIREVDGGRFVMEARGLELCERGKVHSLIADHAETEVVDATTGRRLGTARLSGPQHQAFKSGADVSLSLGGRRREVSRVTRDAARISTIYVHTAEGSDEARFIAREAPRYSAGLAADFARFRGAGPGEMWLTQVADDRWRLDHWLGSAWAVVLGEVLKRTGHRGAGSGRVGAFSMLLTRRLEGPGPLPVADIEASVGRAVEGQQRRLARVLGIGAMAELAPPVLLARWVEEAVDVPALVAHLATARVRLLEAPDSGAAGQEQVGDDRSQPRRPHDGGEEDPW